MKKFLIFGLVALMFALSGCDLNDDDCDDCNTSCVECNTTEVSTRAFFGDKANNRVVIVDVETMELSHPIHEVPIFHEDAENENYWTYTADKVFGKPKVYVVNRHINYMDVIDVNTRKLIGSIPLKFHPRSAETMNKTLNLCEVSGMDKPAAAIIDIESDKVVATVGKYGPEDVVDTENNPNRGGSHATGHPFWLDAHHFVLLDRYDRKIYTYHIDENESVADRSDPAHWIVKQLNVLDTPGSLHQIIPSKGNYLGEKNYFYATAEGADDVPPAIVEFHLEPGVGLELTDKVELTHEDGSYADMWLHHGDFCPGQKVIYVGSGDGTFFVVGYGDEDGLKIVKRLQAGKGAGHTVMVPQRDLAIIINHKDKFVTVVDTTKHEVIKNVEVSYAPEDWVGDKTIQAHPKFHVSKDGKYFYAFLTEEGAMYKIDLDALEMVDTVWTGGKPAQGAFVKYTK